MNMHLGDTRLLIESGRKRGLLRNQIAYVLATAYHETAHTMKPVKEQGDEDYLRSKKYWPYIGRGYVQITWKTNYEKAGEMLGIDFVSEPELLLEPEYAAPVIIAGMTEGWFTGRKLSDYITLQKSDFRNARRIVNGTDKAGLIARYAKDYDRALLSEGYGVDKEGTAPATEVVPAPVEEKSVLRSSRLCSLLSTGSGAAVLQFFDRKFQRVIVYAMGIVAGYAIFTLSQGRARLQMPGVAL